MARQAVNIDIKGRNKSASAFRQAQGGLDKLAKKASVVTGIMSSLTLVTGFAGLSRAISSSIDRLDDLGKAARRANTDVETLQGVRLAAGLGGIAQGQVDKAFEQLSLRAGEAARGLSTYKRAFEELGVAVRKEDGSIRAPSDVFRDTLNQLSNLPNEIQRTALAYNTLGRRGSAIAQVFFDQGRSVEEIVRHYKSLGLILSDVVVQQAEDTKDAFTLLGKATSNMLDNALIPTNIALEESAGHWTNLVGRISAYIAKQNEVLPLLEKGIQSQEEAVFAANRITELYAERKGILEELNRLADLGLEGGILVQKQKEKLAEADARILKLQRAQQEYDGSADQRRQAAAKEYEDSVRKIYQAKLDAVEAQEREIRTALRLGLVTQEQHDAELIRLGVLEKQTAEVRKQAKALMEIASASEDVIQAERKRVKDLEDVNARLRDPTLSVPERVALAEKSRDLNRQRPGYEADLAAVEGEEVAKSATGFFKNIGDSAKEDIYKFADLIRANLQTALLTGDFDKLGDALLQSVTAALLDKALSGVFDAVLGGLFGERQFGGPVSAGRGYLVGERGPELIVPRFDGNVIPNHRMGSMGGGTININLNVNNTGLSLEEVMASGQSLVAQVEARIKGLSNAGRLGGYG